MRSTLLSAHPDARGVHALAAVVFAVALSALATTAVAQPNRDGADLTLPELKTWELDNGMKVALLQVEDAPMAAVEVWYHVGAKEEPPDRRGSAHMFEHMMFRGSERVRPDTHARFINGLGGYVNAATSEDATWYINVLPPESLDFAVQLEAERMRNLVFRDSMIKTVREVVKEEIRQQENNPLAQGLLRFLDLAFTTHPYSWTAAGTIPDLDATTRADLESFYNRYYVPQNAMLVVVGAVAEEAVRASAQKWFGAIPRAADDPPRPADSKTEPAQTEPRRVEVEPGQVGLILTGYPIPAATHDDIYALQVASLILGAGESSRLTERLVRGDGVAVQAGAPLLVREHPGLFVTFSVFINPAVAGAIEQAVVDEITKLGAAGPTAAELSKAKNQLQAALAFGLEDVAGLATQIGSSWILTGDPGRWTGDLARYEAVTAADVKRVITTYLTPQNLNVVVIPPLSGAPAGR